MCTILKLNVWVWQALKTAEIIVKRSLFFSYTAVEFGILKSSHDRFFFFFFQGSFTVALGAQVWPNLVMKARGIAKELIKVAFSPLTSSNRMFRSKKHLS